MGRMGDFVLLKRPLMADTASVPWVPCWPKSTIPGSPQAWRHSLEATLPIATLVVICGVDNWTEVEFFGH